MYVSVCIINVKKKQVRLISLKFELRPRQNIVVCVCVNMHLKIARYLYTFNNLARMFMLKHKKKLF